MKIGIIFEEKNSIVKLLTKNGVNISKINSEGLFKIEVSGDGDSVVLRKEKNYKITEHKQQFKELQKKIEKILGWTNISIGINDTRFSKRN